MPKAWRIVKRRHASAAFHGEGARLFGGRWSSPGTALVYTSESRALATLEVLAGIRATAPLAAYVLIPAEFDEALLDAVEVESLPEGWRDSPPSPATQGLGDDWAAQREYAVLKVPSAIVPPEFNYVLNPSHPDFPAIAIGEAEHFLVDPRLLG